MEIYLLFLQHIIHSLTPTGFITAQSGIDKKIRQHLVENKMLAGVVSMPSNIFATTGTNVSILFIDATNQGDVILIDASALGTKVKEGKNQKTLLSAEEEEQRIIDTFNAKEAREDFSIVVSYDDIAAKNFSLSAGQHFEVKIEYIDLKPDEFEREVTQKSSRLESLFRDSHSLEAEIQSSLRSLSHEE
jgi:type I restriction enzyme M protein